MSVIEMVKGKQVNFVMYRKGDLWYTTESGFEFPVPVSDCGDASFLAADKASLFMRYIKAHLKNIKKGKESWKTS